MAIAKIDVVHLIGGLSQASAALVGVTNSDDATKELLKEIKKLAKALNESPANKSHLEDK